MLTQEQRQQRQNGIGGSDAASVLAQSDYRTPLDVYLDKKGESEEFEGNNFTYFGNLLEPILIQEYETRTKDKVETDLETFIHPEHSFMLANLDGYIPSKKKIVEIKTCSQYSDKKWGDAPNGRVPKEYLIQCAHYMAVLDADSADIAVLIGGNDFRIYTILRDKKLEEELISHEMSFWNNHVLKNNPPDPSTYKEASNIWSQNELDDIKIADLEIEILIDKAITIKQEIKLLTQEERAIKLEILKYMKDSQSLVDGFGEVIATAKHSGRNSVDLIKLKAEHPNIHKQFSKYKPNRNLLIKKKKE